MALESLLPVATLILGGVLQYLGQWGTDTRARRAAEEARITERLHAREERRETFELDHLLRLNEALLRYGRAVGRVHVHDMVAAKESGTYGVRRLPEEINQEAYEAGREVLSLMHMVLDGDLRALVFDSYEKATQVEVLMRVPVPRAEAAMLEFTEAQKRAITAIGARVRAIYLDQVDAYDRPSMVPQQPLGRP